MVKQQERKNMLKFVSSSSTNLLYHDPFEVLFFLMSSSRTSLYIYIKTELSNQVKCLFSLIEIILFHHSLDTSL